MKARVLFVFCFITVISFSQKKENNALVRCNEKLIEVIMEDIFSPPLASRVHVYPNLTAYEILSKSNPELPSLHNKLVNYPIINPPTKPIDFSLAAVKGFCVLAKKLVYSEHLILNFEKKEIEDWYQVHQDSILLINSLEYANAVSNQMIEYLNGDNYNYTRTLMRYELIDHPSKWRPTPPEYMNALEPNWKYMRSFFFDSTNDVKVIPDIPYSEYKNSEYYKNAIAFYNTATQLDTFQKQIAYFWDDNPNTSVSNGHMTYFIHKATPGGHWIRIAGQAIRHYNYNEAASAKVYTLLTLGIYEAFLSCWKEKYRSNAVRPETYVNMMIDPKFKPLIETPPFPEYTSGHSVVSGTSSSILFNLFPKNYAYADSSELEYGIQPRYFKGFIEAAKEASISRYYGGIHYMPSLTNGLIQGGNIGHHIFYKLK